MRKRVLLPGAIVAVRQIEVSDYEDLGGDYGTDDNDFVGYVPDIDDEIPE
jgi:hypothetical protein